MMNLEGKKVLVTGASSGLGRELSLCLGKEGCDLILVSNQKEELESIATEIRKKHSAASVATFCIDLARPDEVESMCMEVLQQKEYLDILINCAGIIIPERIENVKTEDWQKVLTINLTAPFLLVKYFTRSMNEKSEAPLVVNISSQVSKRGDPYCASYVASKFGLNGFTAAINEEYRVHGKLRAISFCPGSMETPFLNSVENQPAIAPRPGIDIMMSGTTSAQMIVDIIRHSDLIDISELVFQARKTQVYKKKL